LYFTLPTTVFPSPSTLYYMSRSACKSVFPFLAVFLSLGELGKIVVYRSFVGFITIRCCFVMMLHIDLPERAATAICQLPLALTYYSAQPSKPPPPPSSAPHRPLTKCSTLLLPHFHHLYRRLLHLRRCPGHRAYYQAPGYTLADRLSYSSEQIAILPPYAPAGTATDRAAQDPCSAS